MILASFAAIPHVEVLRIGSRVPWSCPCESRRNSAGYSSDTGRLWFNTQFNHPSEITPEAARACNMLQEAGIPVSNQSVLLKGVNDSPDVMLRLLYGLQKISVRPYYLFHCEPVKGCGHFRTGFTIGPEDDGRTPQAMLRAGAAAIRGRSAGPRGKSPHSGPVRIDKK